ncbi:MAG: NPCBM/NEW2 domain-containing protein, partial [Thermoguttaceae bacterium]
MTFAYVLAAPARMHHSIYPFRMKKIAPLVFALTFFVSTATAEMIEIWKYLTTDQAVSVKEGWQKTRNNASVTGQGLQVAGQRYQKGLGTHPAGEIVFDLNGKHKVFRTLVGIDDRAPATGSVMFRVFLDGKQAFESEKVKYGEKAREIQLDVTGVNELKLVCTDAGDGPQGDHANWLEAAVDDVEKIIAKPIPMYSVAGFHPIEGSPRKVWSFNPGWRFKKGDCDGAEKPEFDDSDWEAANLPHGLELMGTNLSGSRNYQGPAWYRKVFDVSQEMQTKNTVLYFEAVMGKCKVYVDGELVAENFGGYLPFAADITRFTQKGGRHVVAVLADNSDDASIPPGGSQKHLDFTYLGGIYRDVYLIETNPVHITLPELSQTVAGGGVFVGVKNAKNLGNHEGEAEIEVRTEIKAGGVLKLKTTIEDAEYKEISVQETSVPNPTVLSPNDYQSRVVSRHNQTFELKDIRLWHPDSPYQHWIKTEILDENGNVLDSMRTRFGIRLFEMLSDKGLYVNGEYIGHKLSGVNRHQDYAIVGNAVPNSGQWRDAKLIRQGGSTIVRAGHYPLDPAFMDACDEYGLLVAAAVPGWQFYNDKNPLFWKRCVENTRGIARRDRNRPAGLLWETALNETDNQPAEMLAEMHKTLHDEIPFPSVFSCTDGNHAKAGGLDFYYHGSMQDVQNSLTREYGDGGEVDNFGSQNATSRVPREWGEKALLEQAMIRYRDLPSIFGMPPKRIGATLWCGIDHQRGYHPDPFWGGLLDSLRIPKYSYDVFKSQYDADFVLDGIETGPMVVIFH